MSLAQFRSLSSPPPRYPVDVVYYINLDKRTDRRAQMEAELENVGWSEITTRFSAIANPTAPYLGSLQSHITVLRNFLASNHSRALILEDDVVFFEVRRAAQRGSRQP